MQREVLITISDEKLKVLEEKMDLLQKSLNDLITEKQSIGDWITEERAIKLTGLSKSSFYNMRKEGKITSSSISGKEVWYRRADFKKILDRVERE